MGRKRICVTMDESLVFKWLDQHCYNHGKDIQDVKVEDVPEEGKVTESDEWKREAVKKMAEHRLSFEALSEWLMRVAVMKPTEGGVTFGFDELCTPAPASLKPCPFKFSSGDVVRYRHHGLIWRGRIKHRVSHLSHGSNIPAPGYVIDNPYEHIRQYDGIDGWYDDFGDGFAMHTDVMEADVVALEREHPNHWSSQRCLLGDNGYRVGMPAWNRRTP